MHKTVCNPREYRQLSRTVYDMAWPSIVLVILVITPTFTEAFSLPLANFLKDFATKYQKSSIVMNIPKEISHNQVVKRQHTNILFEPLQPQAEGKVIIHKSHGEVSLVEQDTIKYVSQPIKSSLSNLKKKISLIFFIFLVQTLQYLKKNCLYQHEKTDIKSCS